MSDLYTTRTANLRATKADFGKIDSKRIDLNGKDILDYISDSEFDSYDTRDPQLKNDELDIWNTAISLSEEGHIEVKPFEHTIQSLSSNKKYYIGRSAKIIDNEALDYYDNHIMYWQTDGLTDGSSLSLNDYIGDNGIASSFSQNIRIFSSDLSSLTNGDFMFSFCSKLTAFSSDLSSLTNGSAMFDNCSNLTAFSSDLSSLTNGDFMFNYCSALTSFSSNLSSLMSGFRMFENCSNLTSFSSDLSSLTNGSAMFSSCKLDAQSVASIVHTLPTHESNGFIYIGIGCDNTAEDQLLFAQECDCETWQELLDDFSAKNWTVYFEHSGRPTTTYNMRRGETLPIYAKLEEVTEGEHYAYTSVDGSKFYNISYFHSTNGSTEGYDVFSSLEEAISTYDVTPKN